MNRLLAGMALVACLYGQTSNAPSYSAVELVNGASFVPGLAPNTIVSLFGTNLSWTERTLGPGDIVGGKMPTSLGNVEVYLEGWPAYLYYVSPKQINFLVPSELLPGSFRFWVARQGMRGPIITVDLLAAAPALFMLAPGVPIATHLDWSVVTRDNPAKGGEVITLWATGLGATNPALEDGFLPAGVQWLDPMSDFSVQVDGVALDRAAILYAGVAPGYAGLYQVSIRLPETLAANPEIRLGVRNAVSPSGVNLPVE